MSWNSTRASILEVFEIRWSRIEFWVSSFERLSTYIWAVLYMLYSAWYLACHYLRANFSPHANACIIFCTYSEQCTSGQKRRNRKHQWAPEEGRLYNYLWRNQDQIQIPNWIHLTLKEIWCKPGKRILRLSIRRAGTMISWCLKQLYNGWFQKISIPYHKPANNFCP